ncbi:MAG: hypothetical protein R2709_00140 [Marmoricola sp.]
MSADSITMTRRSICRDDLNVLSWIDALCSRPAALQQPDAPAPCGCPKYAGHRRGQGALGELLTNLDMGTIDDQSALSWRQDALQDQIRHLG